MPGALRSPPEFDAESIPLAVAIGRGAFGGHAGLYFRDTEGRAQVLDLADHHLLPSLPTSPETHELGWVEPSIPVERLEVMAAICESVWSRHSDGRVPYAFAFVDTFIDDEGGVRVAQYEAGLTCGTLVLAVFDKASWPVLERATWDEADASRRTEDRAVIARMARYLETTAPAHAEKVRAEAQSCVRYRPEEVAAASGLQSQPVAFKCASKAGEALLAVVRRAEWSQ